MLAGLLALAGFGLTVGLTAADGSLDHTVRVGVLGAGGVLFLIGALLRYGGPRAVDEREAQLYYRASWVSLIGLLATWGTLSVGLREDIVSLSPTGVLSLVTAVVFGVFFATQWVYRWLI